MENVMAKGIRSYGPGKFNYIVDSYLYELTLDGGADREESYGEGGGWYGFMEIDPPTRSRIHEIADKLNDRLTVDEEVQLNESRAAILFERSDGIVEVDWYEKMADAEHQWEEIEAEFSGGEEDEDEEDDEDDEETDDAFSDEEMLEGYVISDGRNGGYDVVHEHKHVGHYRSMENALEEIEVYMERDKVYPNVYYVNDHGNVDLLDKDGNVIESRV